MLLIYKDMSKNRMLFKEQSFQMHATGILHVDKGDWRDIWK